VCGGCDSDLLLELIRWNEQQEIAWRKARNEASATDEHDDQVASVAVADENAGCSTLTYGTLIEALALPHLEWPGPAPDLLSEDCFRRGEPSLAAVVVTHTTGEVGSAFVGNAQEERDLLFGFWAGARSSRDSGR
jgi:hypothetical protein